MTRFKTKQFEHFLEYVNFQINLIVANNGITPYLVKSD